MSLASIRHMMRVAQLPCVLCKRMAWRVAGMASRAGEGAEMTEPDELRALVAKATPGPWFWHVDGHNRVSLCAPHGGRTTVMDFARQGMHGAQPRFAISGDDKPRGKRGGILCEVRELFGQYENGLHDHPDSTLIVAAVNALPALLDRLEAAELDAARWAALCNLWAHYTEMSVTQDEDGRWSITGVEAVEAEPHPGKWTGDDPDAAIDAAKGAK